MTSCIYQPDPEELAELNRQAETERRQKEERRGAENQYSGPPITWQDIQAGYPFSESSDTP